MKKEHVKGVQSFCFCSLNMQIMWRCRRRRVVLSNSLIIDVRLWRNEAIEMQVCKLSIGLEKLKFHKIMSML